MHELAIAESLVKQIEKIAIAENAQKVLKIVIEIGAYSGVVAHSLEFCFEATAKGTRLENSKLEIKEIPLMISCQNCNTVCSVEPYYLICPNCQSSEVIIQNKDGGQQLTITQVEVE